MSAPNSTTPQLSIDDLSPYHYVPSELVCVIFVSLFAIATLAHTWAAIKYRLWWLIPTVTLAGFGEIVGWAGRLWSSVNVLSANAFLTQIVCTIIAPTPFLAAIFIIFRHMTQRMGIQYSRLTPRSYSRIFLTCDIVALVVQGAGGGIAASANTQAGSNLGGNIMLGGIIFQLIALICFVSLATEFFIRFIKDRPVRGQSSLSNDSFTTITNSRPWDHRLKLMSGAMVFITVVIFIRSIYRTAELADGWNGTIISTQIYFDLFDGAMIVLAMYTLLFFHPGRFLFSEPALEEMIKLESNTGSSTRQSLIKSL